MRRTIMAWWRSSDVRAVLWAGVAVAFGIGVVWLVNSEVGIKEGAVLVTVLLLPTAVYFAMSGRLSEISLPGGGGAKFRATATAQVEGRIQPIVPIEVEKGPLASLQELERQLSDDRPQVLTFKFDGRTFNSEVVRMYLDKLMAGRRLTLVVFLDIEEQVIGYISAKRFSALMHSFGESQDLAERLTTRSRDRKRTVDLPGVLTTTLRIDATNSEALRTMAEHNLDAVLIVDRERRIAGVVERDQLIATMLLAATP
jgi:CBS domain-containing protein